MLLGDLRSRLPTLLNLSSRIAALGVLSIGIFTVIAMVRFEIKYFEPFAVADYWPPFAQMLYAPHWPPPLSFYWLPHGDHRIPLVKLLIVLDFIIDKGGGVFLLVCSYLFQFLHACVIGFAVRRFSSGSSTGWLWVVCLGSSLMGLFHIVNWENLIRPFQVSMILCYFLGTLALTLIVRRTFPPVGPAVVALLAPLCFISAWALWPIMLVAGAAAGRARKVILAIAVPGAILFAFYFWTFRPGTESAGSSMVFSTDQIVYFISLIGKPAFPFLEVGAREPLMILGAAIFTAAAVLFVLPCIPSLRNPMRIWVAANIALLIVSLLMISLGRASAGYAWRYMTPAVLLWIFVGAGIGYELCRLNLEIVFSAFAAMFCLWAVNRLTYQNAIRWEVAGPTAERSSISGAAFAVGVEYNSVSLRNGVDSTLETDLMSILHNRRLMFWPYRPYNRLGLTIERPSRTCDYGKIEGIRPMYSKHFPGFEIAGVSHGSPRDVVVLDARNQVVGVAAKREFGLPGKWFAYLPAAAAGTVVTPVALPVETREGPCIIAQPFKVEGDPAHIPTFDDRDKAGWIPISGSEAGDLSIPRTLYIVPPKSAEGSTFKSVVVRLKLVHANYVYLAIPFRQLMIAYVPLENQWVYVVFHVNRDEEGAFNIPLFDKGRIMISFPPPTIGTVRVDGVWITSNPVPTSDQDALMYLDATQ